MKIRDFIYLDSDRMYSLYSQVFEGVAEHVTKTFVNKYTTDILAKKVLNNGEARSSTEESLSEIESKIMYDNLYSKLEEKLNKVIKTVDSKTDELSIKDIKDTFMFKVVGNAFVHDYTRLAEYTTKFNDIGSIITKLAYGNINKSKQNNINIKDIAIKNGLNLDKEFLGNLKYMSEFFNNNSFEVMIVPNSAKSNLAFNGILKRDFLRIHENRLRILYSNEPIIPWVMVGQLTFAPKEQSDTEQKLDIDAIKIEKSVSDAYIDIISSSNKVESVFFDSKKYKKINLAPIAIYVEHEIML